MAIKRIVTDLAAQNVTETAAFYRALFGMETLMDMGFVETLGAEGPGPLQLSIAAEGGGGAPVPNVTIEVDNVDALHARAAEIGGKIAYDLTDEPWGVRRFFIRDPAGNLVNIMQHL